MCVIYIVTCTIYIYVHVHVLYVQSTVFTCMPCTSVQTASPTLNPNPVRPTLIIPFVCSYINLLCNVHIRICMVIILGGIVHMLIVGIRYQLPVFVNFTIVQMRNCCAFVSAPI